jgi:hypothetical protein
VEAVLVEAVILLLEAEMVEHMVVEVLGTLVAQ